MPTDVDANTLKIIKEILKTPEAINSKTTFELSKLTTDGIISSVVYSINVNTIYNYWKNLMWKKVLINQFVKRNEILMRNSCYGLFDKKKCEELIKEVD